MEKSIASEQDNEKRLSPKDTQQNSNKYYWILALASIVGIAAIGGIIHLCRQLI